MNSPLCHSLDDYLAHDLTGDALERFVAHLVDCPDCRLAVDENARVDALLVAATTPVPAGLTFGVERRLRVARRRRVMVATAALAATVAVVWLYGRPTPRTGERVALVTAKRPEPSAPDSPRPVEPVRVTFPGADMIAVPMASEPPNITFIRVYPVLFSSPESAHAASDSPLSPQKE